MRITNATRTLLTEGTATFPRKHGVEEDMYQQSPQGFWCIGEGVYRHDDIHRQTMVTLELPWHTSKNDTTKQYIPQKFFYSYVNMTVWKCSVTIHMRTQGTHDGQQNVQLLLHAVSRSRHVGGQPPMWGVPGFSTRSSPLSIQVLPFVNTHHELYCIVHYLKSVRQHGWRGKDHALNSIVHMNWPIHL